MQIIPVFGKGNVSFVGFLSILLLLLYIAITYPFNSQLTAGMNYVTPIDLPCILYSGVTQCPQLK